MEVFLKNPLFVGVRIPEIGRIISLSQRLPNISPNAMNWLQVNPLHLKSSNVSFTIQRIGEQLDH